MPKNYFASRSRREFLRDLTWATAALAITGLHGQSKPLDRKLGVALLGLGRYSSGQLGPALRESKNCYLAGVVTGHPEKGERWAADYALNKKNIYNYENFDHIADNSDIDIVYVVTPPALHPEFTIRAAKAGKHVISEKPMATSVADCNRMIAACKAAKVKLAIGYRLHYDLYHRELMRLARDQDFGPFMKMTGDRGFVFGERAWRIDKKLAGGGPMMDLGIYIVHGACMAANGVAPIAVTAHEEAKTKPELFNEVEETIRWTMEFPNGASCDAVTSFNHSSDTFRAEGSKGWIDFKQHAFNYRDIVCETSRGPLIYPAINQQAAQMDDFADCVRTGRDTPVPGELGRRDMQIITAVYEAARTGKRTLVKN
ncbi:MAG: glucose-fructose oxidoreductase [Acidobacteria bacterium]|nr:MAG: glucose-fructose oxidoreductase [Acidobacteriota bacterium]PYY21090.1 MAG: glucose-fructose oxidoreductase [Acidobacteriota bacterium]